MENFFVISRDEAEMLFAEATCDKPSQAEYELLQRIFTYSICESGIWDTLKLSIEEVIKISCSFNSDKEDK